MHTSRQLNHKAVVVALALTLTACGKTPEQHFQQAQDLMQEADYKSAVIELKTVLQEQPDNQDARLLLADVFVRSEAYPDAEKELSRARSLGAPDDQVLPPLAKAYVRMGKPQKALDLKIPVSGLSPRSLASLHAMRAQAQLALGHRAEAGQSIDAGKRADPRHPELLLTQAKLALMDRQMDRARQLTDDALGQDPKLTEALYLKAALLVSGNNPAEAGKTYQQILTNDPSQFRAHVAIAGLNMKKGDIEAADKAIQAAEKVAGSALLVMYARGTLELQRGNLDKASSTLLKVLRVLPDHLPSALAYAMASYRLGDYQQSISYAGKVLGAAPNNLIAAKILAGSHFHTSDIKGAIRILDTALAKHPTDIRLLALAGDANLRAGDYNKAMAYLDKAAKLEPENTAFKARLAEGHLATGDDGQALADLEADAGLSDKPGKADMARVIQHLKSKDYDKMLQAIATLEKELPNNPITHNLRATALLGKQDRAGARKALEQALAIEPKFFPAAANLAQLDLGDKQPAAARKRFEDLLRADPKHLNAMLALADLSLRNKDERTYVSWLEKAAGAHPQAPQPRVALARHLLAKGDKKKALAAAREAVNVQPDNPDALDTLGTTQLALGDTASALGSYRKLAERQPGKAAPLVKVATAQVVAKDISGARQTLQDAFRIQPDHLDAPLMLGSLEIQGGRFDEAYKLAKRMQQQKPDHPAGFTLEGDTAFARKDYLAAHAAFERAHKLAPSGALLLRQLQVFNATQRGAEGEQRLASWLSTHPQDTRVRAALAENLIKRKQYKAAAEHYLLLNMSSPGNLVILNNLAWALFEAKDTRAAAFAQQALKLRPDNPSVQDTYGWILANSGQPAQGLQHLRKANAAAPGNADIKWHMAYALYLVGDKKRANRELESLLGSGNRFSNMDAAQKLHSQLSKR